MGRKAILELILMIIHSRYHCDHNNRNNDNYLMDETTEIIMAAMVLSVCLGSLVSLLSIFLIFLSQSSGGMMTAIIEGMQQEGRDALELFLPPGDDDNDRYHGDGRYSPLDVIE